ncbi:spherulation-specific family 4 protein [Streptomyces sp. PTM05]|uniref:Spherulation-specific family 4 protein n=1 Tax=Streptantibioticus parmotrematis TaxID=2873249 RepID=A0ABS7QT24_9ACTN|nr:spherulation-specific family 4 protein [Streptantibioticus parmotrematis]MBY8886344.1 spherulation-specific family 4 protein [Streptantibioticus parmotrematis]
MKRRLLIGALACAPLLMTLNLTPADATTATGQKIGVPAYFSTGDDASWSALDKAGSGAVAIVNESNGPGLDSSGTGDATQPDPAMAARIKAAHAAGLKVLGYVDTGWFGQNDEHRQTRTGSTSESAWTTQAEGDIDAWYKLYGSDGVDGIFFDDAWGDDCSYESLYATLAQYARTAAANGSYAKAWTVDNPGSDVDPCYLNDSGSADTFVDYEGAYDGDGGNNTPYDQWTPTSAEQGAAPGRFWNLVYNVPSSQMSSVVARSKSDNAGYVYATDLDLPNPWLTTASYMPQEEALDPAS